jgi:hypothetical protein
MLLDQCPIGWAALACGREHGFGQGFRLLSVDRHLVALALPNPELRAPYWRGSEEHLLQHIEPAAGRQSAVEDYLSVGPRWSRLAIDENTCKIER